jgi:8-oxo-dGTP pyrophosphatase MutT (NUDIX family)
MAEPAFTFPIDFIPSAAVAFIEEGGVYLHLRENTSTLRGFMAMPGGKFEKDENGVLQTAEVAARCEAGQEAFDTKFFGEVGDGRLYAFYTVPEISERGIFLCHVFLAWLRNGEKLVNSEPHKHGPYIRKTVEQWLALEAEGMVKFLPATKAVLRHLQAHPELLMAR